MFDPATGSPLLALATQPCPRASAHAAAHAAGSMRPNRCNFVKAVFGGASACAVGFCDGALFVAHSGIRAPMIHTGFRDSGLKFRWLAIG